MVGQRHSRVVRLEILLFGLGCLGTVAFAWFIRPSTAPIMGPTGGQYSFAVSMPDDLGYLYDMKEPAQDLSGLEVEPVSSSPVELLDVVTGETELAIPETSAAVGIPDTESNPYMNVD